MRTGMQVRLAAGLAAVVCAPGLATAQIRVDSSLGRPAQSIAGPQFVIPEAVGSLRGSNLFHSFSTFNIRTGESATFTTATRGIANVVSRVTGGDASFISGALRLAPVEGAPNFFFINPAGVTFGAGAAIDVPGAFHVSTADYVKFADGVFHSDPARQSTLSSAPPEAFGFLGSGRSAVNVNGGARLTATLLQPFSIVAGDITVDNGRAATRGGDIRVVALGNRAGEVPLTGSLPQAGGDLRILNGGILSAPAVGDTPGGSIDVSAGTIVIDRGTAASVTGIASQANSGTTADAGRVNVVASGGIDIVNGGVISSSGFGEGDAGTVSVNAADITIDSRGSSVVTGIFSSANSGSRGNAGNVDVAVTGSLAIVNGGEIASSAFASAGNAGAVRVRAGSLAVERRGSPVSTGIFSSANRDSLGNSGTIDVEVAGGLSILGGSISSSTRSVGDAGRIRVQAGSVLVDALGLDTTSGIFSQAESGSSGRAGTVEIVAARDISILRGGLLSSSTFDSGNAGSVNVTAGGDITIDRAREGTVTGILSNANRGTGHAGSVVVAASGSISLLEGSAIGSSTYSAGDAGSVQVSARDIVLEGRGNSDFITTIASNAFAGSTGRAGTVQVAASGALSVLDGGEISSSAFAAGDAGSVRVSAPRILIDPRDYHVFATGIFSVAQGGTGNAGSVLVEAGSLDMRNGGEIASSTFSAGNAGRVSVTADDIRLDGGAYGYTAIVSSAQRDSSGAAGEVEVDARGSLRVLNGGEIASSTFSSGNAGSVRVNAGEMTIDSRDAPAFFSGVVSQANEGTGAAGNVVVNVNGRLTILASGLITSSSFSSGNAGSVSVTAGDIRIDGTGADNIATGITSSSYEGSGNAGPVRVSTPGTLTLSNGGEISSFTQTTGRAGTVAIEAGNLAIDGQGYFAGVFSNSHGAGDAGGIDVRVTGSLTIRERGLISSSTSLSGNAGEVRVTAGDIVIDGVTLSQFATGIISQAERGSSGRGGLVEVTADRMTLVNRGEIASSTFGSGDAGQVRVRARQIAIDGGGENGGLTGIASQAERGSSGHAGTVDVAVDERLTVTGGGAITSSTFAAGNAGMVRVEARDVALGDRDSFIDSGIYSRAYDGSSGNAGNIVVTARDALEISTGASISSDTYASGNAGSVTVDAGHARIDGGGIPTGIASQAFGFSTGNAGSIELRVAGDLELLDGGQVTTSTVGAGNAGAVRVSAANISILNQPTVPSSMDTTGIFSHAGNFARGDAGTIDVVASGTISLLGGGQIDSTSEGFGRGGSIRVRAHDIVIDGMERFFRTGIFSEVTISEQDAGTIDVGATGDISIRGGGIIASDSSGEGNAGSVRVAAENITIAGFPEQFFFRSGITSYAAGVSRGAGTVEVIARNALVVSDGGQISSATFSDVGVGGSVTVQARSLTVDGEGLPGIHSSINARAEEGSSGQPGNVTVRADDITLSNGGELSINNLAELTGGDTRPTLLSVTGHRIDLRDGGSITAAASGDASASNVEVRVAGRMTVVDSSVSTSAVEGNGGGISIAGEGSLVLRRSQVTTSVSGNRGNGGDISIGTRALVLDTGFIQANTAAADAAGGTVRIDVGALMPSGTTLFVGGSTPLAFDPGLFGFNVIQAAAPTGVSGAIEITTPALDVSAGLVGLSAKVLDTGGLARSVCEITGGSSLAQAGRGGMPASARELVRVEPDHGAAPRVAASAFALPSISCGR